MRFSYTQRPNPGTTHHAGSQVVASISAGWFLFTFGWNTMMFVCMPFILAAFALVAWKTRLDRAVPAPAAA